MAADATTHSSAVPSRPEGAAETPAATHPNAEPKGRSARKPFLILGLLAVGSVGALAYHQRATAQQQETDDAQVEADVVPLSVRIGGPILHVRVHDNQAVHAGDVLLELDPQELASKVAQAEADLEMQKAQAAVASSDVQVVGANAEGGLRAARANVTSAMESARSAAAQIPAAQAGVTRALALAQQSSSNLTRLRALFGSGASSQAELDNALSADEAAQAAVAQARAQLSIVVASRAAASGQIGLAEGRLEQSAPVDVLLAQARARAELAQARVRSSEAALALARMQLSYTTVTAPSDGVLSRLNIHEGQLLQTGQSVAMLVPSATYLVANFKETQLEHLRTGNRAEIRVDAFPGQVLHGVVESLSGGTGARFSLLPPDNASGNFVKVVQRVPIRIRWENVPGGLVLRAGLSADVTVFTQ